MYESLFTAEDEVGFVKFHLAKCGDPFLNLRALENAACPGQQLSVDDGMKQTPPDLLQKFLNGPMLQFALFGLTDQNALRREILKVFQSQFIGMNQMTHIIRRDNLALGMRNCRRQLNESIEFPDDPANDSRLHKVRAWVGESQCTPQFSDSAWSVTCYHDIRSSECSVDTC
jgi:hypothetical protein